MASQSHIVLEYSLMGFVYTKVTSCWVVIQLSHQVHSELNEDIESRLSLPAF